MKIKKIFLFNFAFLSSIPIPITNQNLHFYNVKDNSEIQRTNNTAQPSFSFFVADNPKDLSMSINLQALNLDSLINNVDNPLKEIDLSIVLFKKVGSDSELENAHIYKKTTMSINNSNNSNEGETSKDWGPLKKPLEISYLNYEFDSDYFFKIKVECYGNRFDSNQDFANPIYTAESSESYIIKKANIIPKNFSKWHSVLVNEDNDDFITLDVKYEIQDLFFIQTKIRSNINFIDFEENDYTFVDVDPNYSPNRYTYEQTLKFEKSNLNQFAKVDFSINGINKQTSFFELVIPSKNQKLDPKSIKIWNITDENIQNNNPAKTNDKNLYIILGVTIPSIVLVCSLLTFFILKRKVIKNIKLTKK